MQRHHCEPRPAWREKVEEIGLTFHSHEHGPYWDESACYELTAAEVDTLEAAAHKLHYLCIEAAEAVIRNNWWQRLGIPEDGGAAPVLDRDLCQFERHKTLVGAKRCNPLYSEARIENSGVVGNQF